MTRRVFILSVLIVIFLAVILIQIKRTVSPGNSIKLGILYSHTDILDIAKLAINEINAQGDNVPQLKYKIVPVFRDCKSDPKLYAQFACELITKENVVALFGCETQEESQAVEPILKQFNKILFSLASSSTISNNIIYFGPTPDQYIFPAIAWSLKNIGKKVYILENSINNKLLNNKFIKNYINSLNGQIVGQDDITDSGKLNIAIDNIIKSNPDIILYNIKDESISKQFADIYTSKNLHGTAVIAFNLTNTLETGFYFASNYIQSDNNTRNQDFVTIFKKIYGEDRFITNDMMSIYNAIFMWASQQINPIIRSINTPEGPVTKAHNNHIWRTARLGKIGQLSPAGKFINIVWSSGRPIEPKIIDLDSGVI